LDREKGNGRQGRRYEQRANFHEVASWKRGSNARLRDSCAQVLKVQSNNAVAV
jgi:hypothetical protein